MLLSAEAGIAARNSHTARRHHRWVCFVHLFHDVALLAGIDDFFKPFVPERSLKKFVALFPGCSRYHFLYSIPSQIVDWVLETELKVAQAPWKELMESLKFAVEVKDLKWILLAALITPRGDKCTN